VLSTEKEGVSSHFIVTSVLVDEDQLEFVEQEVERIRKRHFQSGEIKSSKVGNNTKRRLKILEEIALLPFGCYSFIIDKDILFGEGLKFKQSFYKFCNRQLFEDLFKTFPKLKLVADEHGSSEYMESFKKYVAQRCIPNLFNQSEFGFANSKSSKIIQVADFLAGTFGKCFDKKVAFDKKKEVMQILKDRIIDLKEFPAKFEPYEFRPEDSTGQFDYEIFNLSVNLAKQFLNEKIKSDSEAVSDQVKCLRYLLFHFRYINPNEFILTKVLIQNLEEYGNREIGTHYFRSQVIAKLRDKGVIIASSSKGYKLPANEADLYEFINQSSKIIQPMLSRIQKCRNNIKLLTNNKLDILDNPGYEKLKGILSEED
jgi:hypothetical protein